MTSTAPSGQLAVYLLHFEQPVNGHRHYVGITTTARLGARMIEHTTGRGAKLTSSACRLGVAWRLAHIWHTDQAALEARLIKRAERIQLCPVCRKISTGVGYRPTKKAAPTSGAAFRHFQLDQRFMFPNIADQTQTHPVENTR